ncbi:transporter substrate-binding domain-containing protein [Pseudomonas saxonica]|uniref:transporter substrate-binding domain-containing protein n=1 Tax=Pseudomonas saxonica TaxID=2600598 RepID=UPI002D7738B8|nr:transporter substrate-binding domain-containing protein [Pseudomonas saxonica]WRQ75978.1 transporter substrate-binding domain-containing protein [Pseudomonas saxonica]
MSRSSRELKDWFLSVLLVTLASLGSVAHAAQAVPLQLPQSFISPKSLTFDHAQQQFLEQRGLLRVGVFVGDYAPLDITGGRNRYQGISADYLGLIRDTLGIKVSVSGFSKREQAVAALLSGKIDLLTSAGGYERGVEGLIFSADYMADRSVVVGRGSEVNGTDNWDQKK